MMFLQMHTMVCVLQNAFIADYWFLCFIYRFTLNYKYFFLA